MARPLLRRRVVLPLSTYCEHKDARCQRTSCLRTGNFSSGRCACRPVAESSRITGRHPVAWAPVRPVPDPGRIWQALSEIAAETGLVPFLLAGLDETTARPWDAGEFSDPADISRLAQMDSAELLAGLWRDEFEAEDDDTGEDADEDLDEEFAAMIAPFSSRFPGLVPASDQALPATAIEAALGALPAARVGLAVASRPADVLSLIGWDGAVNRWGNSLVISA